MLNTVKACTHKYGSQKKHYLNLGSSNHNPDGRKKSEVIQIPFRACSTVTDIQICTDAYN